MELTGNGVLKQRKMGERRTVIVGKEGGTGERGEGQRVGRCRCSDSREEGEYPYKPMSNTKCTPPIQSRPGSPGTGPKNFWGTETETHIPTAVKYHGLSC